MATAQFVIREENLGLVLGLGMKVFSLNFSFTETFTAIYGRPKEKWLIM